MLTDDEKATVLRLVAETLGIPHADIKPESTFDDLEIDSLAKLEIIVAIEDELVVDLPDDPMEAAATIQDLFDILDKVPR